MSKVVEAHKAALSFVLDCMEDDEDAVSFLHLWREGSWSEIKRDFPSFDLSTAVPCGYKPEPKQIDMTPFIKNGLDCEFSDEFPFLATGSRISKLRKSSRGYVAKCSPNEYSYCRPRLNHPFIWEGQELPEGLVVEYGHWNNEYELIWETTPLKYGNHIARILGCKGGYTFVGE